eukprot:GHVL01022891.1.p1 GENE.GHVL01022891.1~~GHVL01022891.1.p1  ORF type:complete len:369 (+),score=49.44 GHVL01022891.1:52-1158(+)
MLSSIGVLRKNQSLFLSRFQDYFNATNQAYLLHSRQFATESKTNTRHDLQNHVTRTSNTSFVIAKDAIARMPRLTFHGRTLLVTSLEEDRQVASIFKGEKLLGFDTESRPRKSNVNPTACIQLASERIAVVWRIHTNSKRTGLNEGIKCIPPTLKSLITDPKISKVCQGALTEIANLAEEFGIVGESFIDLHQIASALQCSPKSMQGLAAIFLQKQLIKTEQLSDWQQELLTHSQIRYAATDAWAPLQTLLAMRDRLGVAELDCERLMSAPLYTLPKEMRDNKENIMNGTVHSHPVVMAREAEEKSTSETEEIVESFSVLDIEHVSQYRSLIRKIPNSFYSVDSDEESEPLCAHKALLVSLINQICKS